MNILILCPKVPWPPKDGGAIATLSMAGALKKTGNHVQILALNTSKHYISESDIPARLIEETGLETVFVNTRIRAGKLLTNLLFSHKPYNGVRFYVRPYIRRLIRVLRQHHWDIVQLEGPYMGLYLHIIRTHTRARIVMRAHNAEFRIWERNALFEKNPVRRWYYQLLSKRVKNLEKELLSKLDGWLSITRHDEAVFKSLGSQIPMMVAPAGIDTSRIPPPSEQISDSLFFIGALDWIPNQEGLKWFIDEVWPLLQEKRPQLQVHVAGRNAPRWVAEMVREANMVFHGEVPDAFSFMRSHGSMIVPLFAGSGMRIKILEGMAAGIPIISTPIGAEGIEARDGQHILIGETPLEFCEKSLMALKDQGFRKQIAGAASLLVAEKFDSFAIAKGLAPFYNSLRS